MQPHDISIREDPFEWTVFFRAAPDAPEKLQWKTAKKEGEALRVPEGFVLDPEKVMLLS